MTAMTGDRFNPDAPKYGLSPTLWVGIIFFAIFIGYIPVYGVMKSGYLQSVASFFFLVITVLAMWYFPKIRFRTWGLRKWVALALCVALYFVLGGVHSVYRWDRHNAAWYDGYNKLIVAHAKEKGITLSEHPVWKTKQVPEANIAEWRKFYEPRIGKTPSYLNFEWHIKGWLFQWPWSFLHHVIWDWVLEMFNIIYNLLGTTYDWISSRYTRGTQ